MTFRIFAGSSDHEPHPDRSIVSLAGLQLLPHQQPHRHGAGTEVGQSRERVTGPFRLEKASGIWEVGFIWVVVKTMVPFWVPILIRHLIFRVPKKRPQF